MWNISIQDDGRLLPEYIEVPEQPPSSVGVLEAVRDRLAGPKRTLMSYLDQEVALAPDGARDAIELWSRSAVNDARASDRPARITTVGEEALALYLSGEQETDFGAIPATIAWHDRTCIIITTPTAEQDILIQYRPEPEDLKRIRRIRRMTGPNIFSYQLETIFEWRGYFGGESGIIDGLKQMDRRPGGFWTRLRLKAGYIVGYVLHRLTRRLPAIESDPTAANRLLDMSKKYPGIAHACPNLAEISQVAGENVVVFVHGTVSCGIQGLKDLFSGSAPWALYRYEHDTFQPLWRNAEELEKLITSRICAKRLLLAAHSRGGLVARLTLDRLMRRSHPTKMSVYTFGSPHNGTPLVNSGAKILNLLFKLGGDIKGGIPIIPPLVKAYSYLLNSPELPPGIRVMQEGSDLLAEINSRGEAAGVSCWGSSFDIDGGPSGFGIDFEGGLLGALSGIENDLVVPTASATYFGIPQPVLHCSHTQYFLQPNVQSAILSFFSAG